MREYSKRILAFSYALLIVLLLLLLAAEEKEAKKKEEMELAFCVCFRCYCFR